MFITVFYILIIFFAILRYTTNPDFQRRIIIKTRKHEINTQHFQGLSARR